MQELADFISVEHGSGRIQGQRNLDRPEHDAVGITRVNLALSLQAQGKHAEAETQARQALPGRERVVGPDNPALLTIRSVLGAAHARRPLPPRHTR